MLSLLKVIVEVDPVFFSKIEGKLIRVISYRTLFSKKAVKQFRFPFEVCYVFSLMKKKRYTMIEFSCLMKFSIIGKRVFALAIEDQF